MKILVAEEFGPLLFGRYVDEGDYSGEAFRDEVLIPALISTDSVTIDFSGVVSLPSSFLEEAFGGLIRKAAANSNLYDELLGRKSSCRSIAVLSADLKERIIIAANDEFLRVRAQLALEYIGYY